MTPEQSKLRHSFETHTLDASAFRHLDHVQVAYEMLSAYSFIEASAKYAENIGTIATKAGVPHKFNATITFAFLSLIAERMDVTEHTNYEEFIAQNQDILSKNVLAKWYSPERLSSDLARNVFLLPDVN